MTVIINLYYKRNITASLIKQQLNITASAISLIIRVTTLWYHDVYGSNCRTPSQFKMADTIFIRENFSNRTTVSSTNFTGFQAELKQHTFHIK